MVGKLTESYTNTVIAHDLSPKFKIIFKQNNEFEFISEYNQSPVCSLETLLDKIIFKM